MDKLDFRYLIEKINSASVEVDPFKHIWIDDFFSKTHFDMIVESPELKAPSVESDEQLIKELEVAGFKNIKFPGAVTSADEYLKWRSGDDLSASHHSACEGFGYVMRLYHIETEILLKLQDFLGSPEFLGAIAERLGFYIDDTIYDGGIQKYLDGYEISPHPDIRRKAATFMVNINPCRSSHQHDYHTHYMKFTRERRYVQSLWEGNPELERTWVPWTWAETVSQQCTNNSIVLFSPDNDTLHAVKANYDHLKTQRTQLYGNLWYEVSKTRIGLDWEQLDVLSHTRQITMRGDKGQGARRI